MADFHISGVETSDSATRISDTSPQFVFSTCVHSLCFCMYVK
jgi:hypothetical protein